MIFVPKIEQIAYDEDQCGIAPNGFEKCYDATLAHEAGGPIRGAQVKIGEEVDLFSFGDEHDCKYKLPLECQANLSLGALG